MTVYYAFHPLHGRTLRASGRAHDLAIAVTIVDEAGHGLRIPIWMLSPEAAQYQLSDQAIIAAPALTALTELLEGLIEKGFGTLE